MSLGLHFTGADWERIERDWSAWWAGELERPLVILERPVRFSVPEELCEGFLRERPIEEVLDHYQGVLEATRYHGDAFPKLWPNYGPGILAGFLGARVRCDPAGATVWFDHEPVELADLAFRYAPENPWWRRIRDLTRAAVERWGSQVAVAHTDLGGALDVLASFCGTESLLYALADAPDEVFRAVGEITPLWLRYYDELASLILKAGRGTTPWAPIWSPGRCYMFQSDFCCMISPEMFERFVLPDLSACFGAVDHAFYHLDGPGQIRHLDALLSLESLAGIQWIPGAGQPQAEDWLPLLARIRSAGKLCQVYVAPEGARRIARELGGRGFVFYVVSSMSPEDARDYLAALAADDRGRV